MHYEWLDAYLLSFPGVEKDYQPVWQWFRYKVRGRLFAAVCSPGPEYKIYGGHDLVNLKCGAAEGELLRARYPDILPGFYSDKRTWISCLLDGELPKEVLRDLCGRSYALAVEKLPKYVRRELAEQPRRAEVFAMAKKKEEKTNVMRILDQRKIPYTARFYEDSQGPEGTREYGVHVAEALGQDPARGFKTLVARGASQGHLRVRGAGAGEPGSEEGRQGGGGEVHRAAARGGDQRRYRLHPGRLFPGGDEEAVSHRVPPDGAGLRNRLYLRREDRRSGGAGAPGAARPAGGPPRRTLSWTRDRPRWSPRVKASVDHWR